MPANRSRTDRWRDTLWNIYERGGGLEFAIDRGMFDGAPMQDLVWRVRLLGITDDELLIELPGAMGRSFKIDQGTALVGIMTVGQNRWMFHTEVIAPAEHAARNGTIPALRISMPQKVERCQRRSFDRISTAQLNLPTVEAWPLLDPRTAVAAEVANRIEILDLLDADLTGQPVSIKPPDPDTMPEVGPSFNAHLGNLGGGGVGLAVDRSEAGGLDSSRLFWLRINLCPIIPAPLALTAKLAHTHVDSSQRVYAGLAFDFGFNPSHKSFVIGQVDRYLRLIQQNLAA